VRLPKAIRNLTIPLPVKRATGPLRDQTRIARARLAELTLKMHSRPHDGDGIKDGFSLRPVQDSGTD